MEVSKFERSYKEVGALSVVGTKAVYDSITDGGDAVDPIFGMFAEEGAVRLADGNDAIFQRRIAMRREGLVGNRGLGSGPGEVCIIRVLVVVWGG